MRMKTTTSIVQIIGIAATTLFVGISNVSAAGIGGGAYAYPAAGQSEEQTSKDTFECHNWSVQTTGFDPTKSYAPPPSYATSPPPSSGGGFGSGETGQGGVMRDAAGGAALGAIGGAIAGDAGKGAAIGALAGGLFGGAKRSNRHYEERRWQEQQQMQQMQQQQAFQQELNARTNEYRRAFSACMSSRKYTVQ
jgi:Glycine zipper